MIVKNYQINKIDVSNFNFFLLYGNNQGYKNEITNLILSKKKITKTLYYENEVLKNIDEFFDSIITKSFFENNKFIIIKQVTDKFFEVIEKISEKNIQGLTIVLDSDELTKKSKIRSFFEKDKGLICIPFYNDDLKSLNIIINNFFKDKKKSISRESINLIVERSNGSREHLLNELQKIENFTLNKKEIKISDVMKLTNLSENYNISELVDNCLAKNKTKLIKIINENNFSNDETILIIRTFLAKSKRLYELKCNTDKNQNIDIAITQYKPPIFWKDKDLVKKQIMSWSKDNIRSLMSEINDTELLIKKNFSNSINLVQDFMFKHVNQTNNYS